VVTAVLTVLLYAGPAMGMPKMDVAAMLASLVTGESPAEYGSWWWFGMIWHFLNGSINFPLLYAGIFAPWLPGDAWARGLWFGILLWLAAQVFFNPIAGMGVFASLAPNPGIMVVGSLLGHAVYGVILGALAGLQVMLPRREAELPR